MNKQSEEGRDVIAVYCVFMGHAGFYWIASMSILVVQGGKGRVEAERRTDG